MPDNTIKEKKIYPYLDIVRIIACYFVILNHSLSDYINAGVGSAMWFSSFAPLFMAKSAVPLFFMITGALFLGKIDTYKKNTQRILRAGIALTLISVYAIFYETAVHQGFSFKYFLSEFFSFSWIVNPVSNALWYMFFYIAILVMMPILQRLNSKMEKKDYLYFFFFSFIYIGCMDFLTHYTDLQAPSHYFKLPVFATDIGFLFLGYYIHKLDTVTKKQAIAAAVGYLTFIPLSVLLTYRDYCINPKDYAFLDANGNIVIIVPTVCLFVLIKYFTQNKVFSDKKISVLRQIGACTFGAYLLGDFIIKPLDGNLLVILENVLTPLPARLVFSFIVFLSAMLITYLLRRIPFVKKII